MAKKLSILDVANQLGMELKRTGSYSYEWVEHDSFVINARDNTFYWNSRSESGDVIQLVETVRDVSYREAMNFLEKGEFSEVDVEAQLAPREPFRYSLEKYEHEDFTATRSYLQAERGLARQTVDFFLKQGSIAEATRKKGDYFEPVIVFKYKDSQGALLGASLQGIVENQVQYPDRGRLKQIMRNSDGQSGFSVDIGKPERLVFAESPIDLMSYYELHQEQLENVRLVAMDGLKSGIIGRRFMELYAEMQGKTYEANQSTARALETVVTTTDFFKNPQNQHLITLAVDNDEAGRTFISRLQEKDIPFQIAIPPITVAGNEKADWNDFLKQPSQIPSELVHLYSVEKDEVSYQGYFSRELAEEKARELTTDKVQVVVAPISLTNDEVRNYQETTIESREVSEPIAEYQAVKKEQKGDIDTVDYQTPFFNSEILDRYVEEVMQHYTDDISTAEYLFPDGRMVSSWEFGTRGDDHRAIRNYFDVMENPSLDILDSHPKDFWNLVHNGLGAVRLVPETQTALIVENQILTPEQQERLNHSSLKIEKYQEGQEITPEYLENLGVNMNWSTQEKSLDNNQETESVLEQEKQDISEEYEKAHESITQEQNKNERTSQYKGSLQPEAEGSTSPVLETSTFERSVTSRPTISSQYLNISIKGGFKSSKTHKNHSIDQYDLSKLNRRGHDIQEAAQFYREYLANSKINYFTSEGNVVQVNFLEENFMHLTGLKIISEGVTPEQILHDFANGGKLSYDDIRLGNNDSPLDKIKVLPDLEAVLKTDSFYFDQLQDIPRYEGRFDSLIKADDKDIMLLFRATEENGTVPVSVFKTRPILSKELEVAKKNIILGIYRERDGLIEQLSINEDYVKDNGKEMMEILRNRQYEEVAPEVINPKLDRDHDGLPDRVEEAGTTLTDSPDSDGDGISDYDELAQGTDPNDPTSNLYRDEERQIDAENLTEIQKKQAPVQAIVEEKNQLASMEDMTRTNQEIVTGFILAGDTVGLNNHLKEGVKQYLDSEHYKNYLDKMSQLNNYSSRNIQLILSQNPNASYVASYNKWKKEFERNVKKGEKALKVIAPIAHIRKDSEGNPLLDQDGKPQTYVTFKTESVFDVSQTEGKDLPKSLQPVKENLSDLDYANLYRSLKTIANENQVHVRFDQLENEAKGYYSSKNNEIVIRKDMGKSQIIKTFLHETAHSELHHANHPQRENLTYSNAELQAESVAYVVASYYGMDTSDYSFGYLAGWSNDKKALTDLEAQLDIVNKEARDLIQRIDSHLEKIKEVQLQKNENRFEQKLKDAQEKTESLGKEQTKKEGKESKKEKGISV